MLVGTTVRFMGTRRKGLRTCPFRFELNAMTKDQQRLAEIQDSLAPARSAVTAAETQLEATRQALEAETTQATIENRAPATTTLIKAVAESEAKFTAAKQRAAAFEKAADHLKAKIDAERDERIAEQLKQLRATTKPMTAKVDRLMVELAVASFELLMTCQSSAIWGTGIDATSVWGFLYPPADVHDPNADLDARNAKAQLLSDCARAAKRITQQAEPKKLQKVG
jgi:hypothetical protein